MGPQGSDRLCAKEGEVRKNAPTRHTKPSRVAIRARGLKGTADEPLPGAGIQFDTPESILEGGDAVQAAINANPELGGLFFVNPALVLEELGFEMTPEVKEHINHALAQGEAVGVDIDRLESEIRERLGDAKGKWKLLAPKHIADILFDVLDLTPLDLSGASVPYASPASSPRLAKLQAKAARPRRKLRLPAGARGKVRGMALEIGGWKPTVRFVDLDAPVPELPAVKTRPESVALSDLFFYLPAHPVVRLLLEHAMAHDRRLHFRADKHFQMVRDGEVVSPWRSWIRAVRYGE